MIDTTFRALGTDVRVRVDSPLLAARARSAILAYDARLSRFRPDSELSALNADPRDVVPSSALLREAVRAGLWAAERSDGLVDPCLLDQLEAAGYRASFVPSDAVPPLPETGHPRPAAPNPAARWRRVRVDEDAAVIERPAGVRLDLGGSGKGHVVDRVARMFRASPSWVVDAGGDLRVGGTHEVHVADTGVKLTVRDAAVATSSVLARAWGTGHHLLDPATGEPCRTGVVSATAVAPTALEAETLAKTALLSGPERGRQVLAQGGVLVHEDGDVEVVG